MHVPDEVDKRILEVLRRNARTPVTDIAREVGLSPAPVARRIDRLVDARIIRGFTAIVDEQHSGELEAFTEIQLEGSTETGVLADMLKSIPEIQSYYTIAGTPDALVRIRVRNVDHLQQIVNTIRRTGKLVATKTLIVLYSWERRDHPDDRRIGRPR